MVHFNTISIISTMSDTEISAFLEQELSKKGVVSVFTPTLVVDSHTIQVTFRLLSRKLSIHVNSAKK